ncbi:hypothetical protein DM77_1657 [Burkholderia mallei]|nr:hypothetical protein DM46_1253 [Burkholderia mallei]KOT08046.1 hypothetical protein DM77_1657 [Burkholderia mallei]
MGGPMNGPIRQARERAGERSGEPTDERTRGRRSLSGIPAPPAQYGLSPTIVARCITRCALP